MKGGGVEWRVVVVVKRKQRSVARSEFTLNQLPSSRPCSFLARLQLSVFTAALSASPHKRVYTIELALGREVALNVAALKSTSTNNTTNIPMNAMQSPVHIGYAR